MGLLLGLFLWVEVNETYGICRVNTLFCADMIYTVVGK